MLSMLSLHAVRLQFRDASGGSDANWLMVAGEVVGPDGRWTFSDPCLTTWEAHTLGIWLRRITGGLVTPTPEVDDTDGDADYLLTFIEPNLAFSCRHRSDEPVRLRARLS